MSEIAYVESGKTYIVEVPGYLSLEQAKSMIETLEAGANGARFIIMDGGAKLARLAGEAEKAIQRVRELHKPSFVEEPCGCGDIVKQCIECLDHYPCPTIRALDGEQE